MAERWVLNASPVIALSKIGYEQLFLDLADQVVVPRAVAIEIQAGPTGDPARLAIEEGKISVIETPSPLSEILAWDLGAGETAVLSFAQSQAGWVAVLDDAAARKCARSFSIPVKDTLGIVLIAKQRGVIDSASDLLKSLRSVGFRLDNGVIRSALAQTVGEDWE